MGLGFFLKACTKKYQSKIGHKICHKKALFGQKRGKSAIFFGILSKNGNPSEIGTLYESLPQPQAQLGITTGISAMLPPLSKFLGSLFRPLVANLANREERGDHTNKIVSKFLPRILKKTLSLRGPLKWQKLSMIYHTKDTKPQ